MSFSAAVKNAGARFLCGRFGHHWEPQNQERIGNEVRRMLLTQKNDLLLTVCSRCKKEMRVAVDKMEIQERPR
jgi:hypothetical protein